MKCFNQAWYLIYTRPRQEKKVASELSKIDIRPYLPLIRDIRQWHDRKKVIQSPLFPSYVFVYLTNMDDFYQGLTVEGVVNYVRFGNQVVSIRDSVIDSIRLAIDACADIEVTYASFTPGQILKIQEGPLSGMHCELLKFNGKQKALVRVSLLNRSVLVDLSLHMVTEIV